MAELTIGERKVLRKLVEYDKLVSASELAGELQERNERVISILNSVAEKGLIKLDTKEHMTHRLTDEGRSYVKDGLPEERLFDAVVKLGGLAKMEAAVALAGLERQAKGISVNWARKNGWLAIEKAKGTTILKAKVENAESSVKKVLVLLNKGNINVPTELAGGLEAAVERTLVEEEITKIFEASIVKKGRIAIKSILSQTAEGITDLTPELIASGEGFNEWYGPYVETEFWNNDVLFVPQDHVAREVQDQFKITEPYDHGDVPDEKYYRRVKAVHENGGDTGSTGWEAPFSREVTTRLCLRSHTTPVSIRYLWEHPKSPQKMFIIDRNFRSESLDASHAQEFNQFDGIIMDKGLTLRDLMGYLKEVCHRMGIKKVKFKPGQFPFTEPSIEGFAKHDTLGWIEVAPGGIFRPEVTRPLGIADPVLAWGIGAGRLYMASMDIKDIRDLFSRDLTWLRRAYFVR
jgi:phenylalanyl-tRNA synthetase alpha chain